MAINIALAGNPNSGKTTLFNALTGSNQYVGNWPGVTIEKKEGSLKYNNKVNLIDLPGIYSLAPYSLEEIIARNYLVNEGPDAIINIVDGTNLERNLYLTTQLAELGIPMVVTINMMDVVEKKGDVLYINRLSEKLGCPVIGISALKRNGIEEAAEIAIELIKKRMPMVPRHRFSDRVESSIGKIEELIKEEIDEKVIRDRNGANRQRWLAIKIFERDEKVMEQLDLDEAFKNRIEEIVKSCEVEMDDDAESIITNERYLYITSIVKDCYKRKNSGLLSTSDKIDKIVTNRWLALLIFALVMFVVYYVSVTTVGTWITDWTNDRLFGEIIPSVVEGFLASVGTAEWLQSLILDGIIGGVGAVLGFIPQMLVLFAFLAFLEECGYMARIAFIMDRIFRKFGLSGKSFVPMLVGSGCGVPGIMASRTIENDRDRKMTIILTTFIPCGAKLPIIALISGAMFNGAWWVAPSAYFAGIAAIICSGIILKKTRIFTGDTAPFVMELPPYHWPIPGNVLRSVWERGWSFVKKAGTIIMLSAIFVWLASNFGIVNGKLNIVEDINDGFLSMIGKTIAPIFAPLGWGNWQSSVATITGLIAKENVVSTFGVLYGFADVAEDGLEIWGVFASGFTALSAYSLLIFNLLCAPCFAAIGAIRREMNSAKWTLFAIGYQTGFAYAVSLWIYQLGSLFAGNDFGIGTAAAIIVAVMFLYLLFRPNKSRFTQRNAKLLKAT